MDAHILSQEAKDSVCESETKYPASGKTMLI